jgi:hypothetical protein
LFGSEPVDPKDGNPIVELLFDFEDPDPDLEFPELGPYKVGAGLEDEDEEGADEAPLPPHPGPLTGRFVPDGAGGRPCEPPLVDQ